MSSSNHSLAILSITKIFLFLFLNQLLKLQNFSKKRFLKETYVKKKKFTNNRKVAIIVKNIEL